MRKFFVHAVMSAALLSSATAALAETPADRAATTAERAAAAEEKKRLGSHHLRCDGKPDNMSDGESFARLLGAVTLLGLFAPAEEMADPSKRLFGAKGIEACSRLIDQPDGEANGFRRVPLILARALHQIEAQNYTAALVDVEKARGESTALGLIGNPYFDRTMGLSFDVIEAEARLRANDPATGRTVGVRKQAAMPYSFYAAAAARPFGSYNRDLSPAEESFWQTSQRVMPGNAIAYALRLEDVGRFAEAVAQREALIILLAAISTTSKDSSVMAETAVAHALAGSWDKAAARAAEARTNMDTLAAAGKPEADQSQVVELLDFFDVLKLAHDGKPDEARRNFAARSQWTAPSLGVVMAATERLRQGAKPDQLFGALGKPADALWQRRRELAIAQRIETDKNNRSLFTYILPYANIRGYESLSKDVWRTDKPRLIERAPMADSKFWFMSINSDAMTQPDALLLHAAMQAKAKGFPGFVFLAGRGRPSTALVQFGRKDDPAIAAPLYLDADAVIAEMRQLIPSPAELEARRKAKPKA